MLNSLIIRMVEFSVRHAWGVILAAAILSVGAGFYTARHFAIDTDINNLLSSDLPWRQRQLEFQTAFPQSKELLLVVVQAPTAESADAAAHALAQGLQNKPDVF